MRRSVGDEDVAAVGDKVPLCFDLRASLKVEGPIEKPGLPRAAVEMHAVDGEALILEVACVCEPGQRVFWHGLKAPVMVASDDDLVRVWEGA